MLLVCVLVNYVSPIREHPHHEGRDLSASDIRGLEESNAVWLLIKAVK